jgi:hypothetical protein
VGFFKDLKSIREAAEELGELTGIPGGGGDMSHLLDDRGEREILESGASATAMVSGILMPVPGDMFTMQVPMQVHPPQGAPYDVQYVFPAARMQAPLSPGLDVPIKIAKDDPKRIAVDWDAHKAAIAAAGGPVIAAQQGLARFGGGAEQAAIYAQTMGRAGASPVPPAAPAATVQPTAAPAGAPELDPKARLEQLGQLKGAGLIADDEYRQKKQQIIDEL